MAEGFCRMEQADVALDAHGHCLTDESQGIPASWGSRDQTWTTGGWSPEIARPDGYVYVPKNWAPVVARPKRQPAAVSASLDAKLRPPAEPKRRASRQTTTRRVGDVKVTSRTVKVRPARTARPLREVPLTRDIVCSQCLTTFTVEHRAGGFPGCCSEECRKIRRRKTDSRAPMSASGRSCALCGRSDLRHGGRGLCAACHSAGTRRKTGGRPPAPRVACPVCERVFAARRAGPEPGRRRKHCSAECRDIARRTKSRTDGTPLTMAELGTACVQCKRNDVPEFRTSGLCAGCRSTQRRRATGVPERNLSTRRRQEIAA